MRFNILFLFLCLAACAPVAPITVQPNSGSQTGLSSPAAAVDFSAKVNAFRRENGRAPLTVNAKLQSAAADHAQDMARTGVLSHRGSDGSSVRQRVTETGYAGCYWAENVAEGYPTQAAVFDGWRNSAGHRRNLLSGQVKEFGAARVGRYWVMVFAAPC